MSPLKIVFMGTPSFAAWSLQRLVETGCSVVAVVTAPDNVFGRRQTLSPVKQYALAKGIPLLQPTNLKSARFLKTLAQYEADLQVVVAFRKLPEVVWRMPRLGTFNLHASLLPNYRGAAPIPWVIINGEKETGVTTFFIQETIDTGPLILQEIEPIREDDNAGTLHDRLMLRGAELVLKTIEAIRTNRCPSIPQPILETLHPAPKIFGADATINWDRKTEEIIRLVRGMNPHPGARTEVGGRVFKIFSASPASQPIGGQVGGRFVTDGRSYLYGRTADGWLSLDELQPEGKRKMPTASFLKGNRIEQITYLC